MANHLTQQDQMALKINEIVRAMNTRGLSFEPIQLLECVPRIEEPSAEVKYPEYSDNICEAYELAPCPFCGYDKIKEPATRGFPVYAQCPKCNACGPERLTAPEAVKAWETRWKAWKSYDGTGLNR